MPVKSSHHKYSSASTLGQEEIAEIFALTEKKWTPIEEDQLQEEAVAAAAPTYVPPPRYSEENIDFVRADSTEVFVGGIEEILEFEELRSRENRFVQQQYGFGGTSRIEVARPEMVISNNMPQRMDTMEQQQQHNFSHRGISGICGVAARLSGIVSFAVQTVVLVLSCLLVGLLFVHAGGHKYFDKTKDGTFSVASETFLVIEPDDEAPSTIGLPDPQALLPPVQENDGHNNGTWWSTSNSPEDSDVGLLNPSTNATDDESTNTTAIIGGGGGGIDATMVNPENQTFNIAELEMIGNSMLEEEEHQKEQEQSASNTTERVDNDGGQHFVGPFAQIHPVLLRIGRAELDVLAMLRALCILYGCACALWLISLIGLLISLKLEILDLVYVNTFLLAIVTALLLVNSIAGAVLIVYQTEYHWKVLVTISVIEGGFLLCFLFNCLAICFIVIWYRYIDYMNAGNEACVCLSTIVGCIKGRRSASLRTSQRNRQPPEQNYTIPEATRPAQLPYIDDAPIHQFSNF